MTRFPWARAMEIGLGFLHLAPDQFWHMTLPELAAAARGAGFGTFVQRPMSRSDFQTLAARFPDHI